MKNTSGFTLVTVLILTSMASIVVLSTIRDSVIQERLSGNFQKN
ncbi:pilus assembly PilX N-terminal domain-containing protein [Pseudoalteromonas sp. B131b]